MRVVGRQIWWRLGRASTLLVDDREHLVFGEVLLEVIFHHLINLAYYLAKKTHQRIYPTYSTSAR